MFVIIIIKRIIYSHIQNKLKCLQTNTSELMARLFEILVHSKNKISKYQYVGTYMKFRPATLYLVAIK